VDARISPDTGFGSIPFEQNPVRWMERSEAFARPRQQRSRERLERVVTSAVALFAKRGFEATRMTDIASHAQVPVGTVYQHFADKDALLGAIVQSYRACRMQEIHDLCTSAEARAASPAELVRLHLDIVFSAFTCDAGLLRLIERMRLENSAVHREQSGANETVAGLIADRLIEKLPGRDPVQLRRQVFYLHSIIRGAVVWSVLPTGGELGAGLQVTDNSFAQEALLMSLRYLALEEQPT